MKQTARLAQPRCQLLATCGLTTVRLSSYDTSGALEAIQPNKISKQLKCNLSCRNNGNVVMNDKAINCHNCPRPKLCQTSPIVVTKASCEQVCLCQQKGMSVTAKSSVRMRCFCGKNLTNYRSGKSSENCLQLTFCAFAMSGIQKFDFHNWLQFKTNSNFPMKQIARLAQPRCQLLATYGLTTVRLSSYDTSGELGAIQPNKMHNLVKCILSC